MDIQTDQTSISVASPNISITPSPKWKNIPPTIIERNGYGLLENIEYIYTKDGLVDWRRMIPSEFLVPNKLKTTENDISKLEDKDLIILLGGIKYLAQLRGFCDVSYSIHQASLEQVIVSCVIGWIPNYETDNKSIYFSSIAGASLENTNDFGKNYLPEIAENRAFCRCVRNFLKINIVSKEELGGNSNGPTFEKAPIKEINILKDLLEKKNVTFETLKEKLVKEEVENAQNFQALEDLPTPILLDLIERLRKFKGKN